ncbi:carbohydrate ABC transporter permease [Lapidilactobacillus luobeiensis]|uniref:carbohydrate ABC transporter permease n=1 Tax=Lapidilactobacillus luobeiensis TaxID=2950371 RepID=UPI0021C4C564|nr:sugar ABC transporter permease [Lapidilactobacillus luobeiensis]
MTKFFNKRAPYLFVSPAILLLLMFSIIPILIAFVISFTDMSLNGLADFSLIKFVGVANYVKVFQDPIFVKALGNTVFYVIIGVPLVIVCSLGLALLINFGQNKVFSFFRLVFYSPSITNVVAVAVVWAYLYNPQFGLFNYLLKLIGLQPVPWLQDPIVAKISLILLALWRAIGVNMIIFLAALQGIPKAYYEAAELDGANARQRLFHITIPMLKFATFFVSVTTLIGWIQFFEEPFVMTQGGPLDSTTSLALFIYRNGFQLSKFGYAAAGSFVLFVIIILVTLLQFRIQRKQEETEL